MPDRRRTFEPSYDLDGPYLPRPRASWTRFTSYAIRLWVVSFIAGAVGKHLGIF
jgi:hypothetical protein